MAKHEQVTWNSVGGITLAVLVLSCGLGILLSQMNIQLESSLPRANLLLYYLVGGLPSVIAFFISVFRLRPKGKAIMLIALPIFSSVIFFFYLAGVGSGIPYIDIKCSPTDPHHSNGLVNCQLHSYYARENAHSYETCQARRLFLRPFLRVDASSCS